MIHRRLLVACLAAMPLCAFRTGAHAEESWDVMIQTAAAATSLSSQDADRGLAVRVQGVVTWTSNVPQLFFVQDATGGVAVTGPCDRQVRDEIKPGVIVDVQGVTAGGDAAPSITARPKSLLEIKVLGEGEMPEPSRVTGAQLKTGAFSDEWVEVEGVVRAVENSSLGPGAPEATNIIFVSQGERLTATVPAASAVDLPEGLLGATIRLRGVFHGDGVSRFPLVANRILMNTPADIAVTNPAREPSRLELQNIGGIEAAYKASGIADRVRVRGIVTLSVEGKGMFVEHAGEAIWVETARPAPAGTTVDVAGFPGLRDGSVQLQDAVWETSTDHVSPVDAPLITAEEALSGAFNARLVKVEALLLTVSATGDGTTLVLQSGERVFLARTLSAKVQVASAAENSWLRVTGVCVNNQTPGLPSASTGARNSESFYLLLSGPDALEVARHPNWWTLRRIAVVIGALALAAAGSVGWAATLRRRVAQQTGEIREHLAREAVAQERVRIARELHDSVQQDLLGITMQLKATNRLLDEPDRARKALQLASAMVRRSQAETHRAIWDLRDDTGQSNLVSTLREVLRGLSTDGSPNLEVRGEGDVRPLPTAIENHLLRIAQEAVTNALKHSGASVIQVELRYEPERLTLQVRDDGRGFDADHPPAAATGHFGLFGMRERATKIGADLRITSRPGAGTALHL
ncbi:MAG: sensor histidine kinase, partial [Chthoniobacteraceae bacterium]